MAKEQWRSGLGFVLAAAGSAVGLGNLWGFAYRASQGGGGAFLLLYVLIVLLVCLPVLVAEMVLGRSTGQSPLLAPVAAAGRRWQPMGWLFVLAASGILAFYAVLMGWTGATLVQTLTQGLPADISSAEAFFAGLSGGRSALIGQLLSLVATAAVVAAGVRGGIERLSRWGLPLLFVLLIGLAVWAAGLDGASEGYRTFLLRWDNSQLQDPTTIRNAFTQAFFSIGTGIGSILAYSAYLSRRAHLPREAVAVVGMDTAVGLLAGMVTFPVVMSFGLQDVISGSTLGTIFIALPTGLGSLGATGQLVAVLFFALALIAAITSAVSLLEVPVACFIDRLGWSRSRAVWVSTALIFVAGLPAATSMEVLGWMDSVFGGLLLILGGLLLALLLGWVLPARFQEELSHSGSPIWLQRFLLVMLRWISPPVIAVGLVISVVDLIPS
ncbi:sodium-dependent transporter [Synechococcus sp. CC9605]|uniref:sodium-dependent transporter n=1 Tax=Synechococcus sp. (strain CC9605) TaxID=110662 RepID=UPI00005D5CD3|nr:sodium-dependent transporter [Synechococcus sp. CC9605]ABB35710.1 putative sodium-dependent transporter, NSS family [Synechococcus sp. CC9605]